MLSVPEVLIEPPDREYDPSPLAINDELSTIVTEPMPDLLHSPPDGVAMIVNVELLDFSPLSVIVPPRLHTNPEPPELSLVAPPLPDPASSSEPIANVPPPSHEKLLFDQTVVVLKPSTRSQTGRPRVVIAGRKSVVSLDLTRNGS